MTPTPAAGRPLARFSVLDLTTVRSGPTCTKILVDFGKELDIADHLDLCEARLTK